MISISTKIHILKQEFHTFIIIFSASSFLIAIILPLTKKALGSLEGLTNTGIIFVPLTSPISNNLLFIPSSQFIFFIFPLLFNCNSETAVKKFDVMADRPVQCFVGSSSAQQNLTLIPREKLPCLQPLNESHKKDILTGLDEIIPGYLSEKIWDMIWQRWLYYEDFCNKK